MNNELTLSILNDIDDSTVSSELYVIESFMDMFDKELLIYDNTSSYEVFTESAKKNDDKGVGDRLKDYSKNDPSKIITAIAFIPRLIVAIAKTISSKFAKTGIGKAFKSINDYFDEAKSAREKRERVKELNEKTKPLGYEFYYDEVKGKIRLKASGKRFLILLGWLNALILTTYSNFKKLKKSVENRDDNAITRLKDDFKKLLGKAQNQEKLDPHDMIDDSIDSISLVIKNISGLTAELAVLGAGATELFKYKNMKAHTKDDPMEADVDAKMYKDLAETSSYLTKIVGIIAATVGSLNIISKWGEIVEDISHSQKRRADKDKLILDRVTRKGLDKDHLTTSEWKDAFANEIDDYNQDVEEAYKRILDRQGKEDTKANRAKYVSSGELEDMIEVVFKEKCDELEARRNNSR